MSDTLFLTPQDRVEQFEQVLQGILADTDLLENSGDFKCCARLAEELLNIWAASQACVWVREKGEWKPFRAGLSREYIGPSEKPANFRLLELATEQGGILWIEPSATHSFWRAISSVGQAGQVVLDLAYDSSRGPLPLPRDVILLGLEHNANLLSRFGDSFWVTRGPSSDASRYVDSIAMESMQQRRMLCDRIGGQLRKLEGKRFETLEENQRLATSIHRLLEENGLRLQCTSCGEPAILRCLKAGNSPAGSFMFDHRVNGRRTMHGGRAGLPGLIVVDKTPRLNFSEGIAKLARVGNQIQIVAKIDTVA